MGAPSSRGWRFGMAEGSATTSPSSRQAALRRSPGLRFTPSARRGAEENLKLRYFNKVLYLLIFGLRLRLHLAVDAFVVALLVLLLVVGVPRHSFLILPESAQRARVRKEATAEAGQMRRTRRAPASSPRLPTPCTCGCASRGSGTAGPIPGSRSRSLQAAAHEVNGRRCG